MTAKPDIDAAPCDDDQTSPDCPALVSAYGVRNSTGVRLDWDAVCSKDFEQNFDWVWVNLNANARDAADWARRQSFIPPAAADALLAVETRPRTMRFEGGVAVNLRGVNHNPGAEPEDMVSLRIWADGRHVVTARRRLVEAIADVEAIIEKPASGPATPGDFVALLALKITAAIEPYVEEIADSIDELEDMVIDKEEKSVRSRLAEARRVAVQLRRYIAPQRDAINMLAASDIDLFSPRARISLRESSDHVTRMTEEIDAARERAMVLHDQIMDQRSENMNRSMLILSTVAAIFLPLHFLVGLLGINVAGIPGAENPLAFWVVVGIALTIGGALIGFFRSRGWI